MDTRQHLWISRVIVLGVTLLEGHAGFDKVKQSNNVVMVVNIGVVGLVMVVNIESVSTYVRRVFIIDDQYLFYNNWQLQKG